MSYSNSKKWSVYKQINQKLTILNNLHFEKKLCHIGEHIEIMFSSLKSKKNIHEFSEKISQKLTTNFFPIFSDLPIFKPCTKLKKRKKMLVEVIK